jgi:hypothetical protein
MQRQTTLIETPKDRPFNPYRSPKSKPLITLVDTITGQLLSYEAHFKTRKRQRNQKSMESFKKVVSSIICDLVHNQLTTPNRLVYISLSKRVLGKTDRYTSPLLSKIVPDVLQTLCKPEMAFVIMEKGYQGFDSAANRRTTITCGPRLLTLISHHQICLKT